MFNIKKTKKIKFKISILDYEVMYKKSILLPEKIEIVKITLDNREFIPNQKIIVTKNIKIPIMDIYDKKLFTEKKLEK